MMPYEKIKNSGELEFAVFCIENVAAKLDLVHNLKPSNNSDSESIVVDGVSR